jgi:hypothetical protein
MTAHAAILRTALAGLLLLLAGCAPFVLASGRQSLSEYGFDVTVPDGWYRAMRGEASEALVVTRDGLALQQIVISRAPVDKELKHTKRRFDAKLPPHELAEITLDNMRSDPAVHVFAVEENVPATINGRQGYKVVYTWALKGGYRLKRVHYGFLDGTWVYQIVYQAAARHYFDRDLATFEQMRESFQVNATPA